MWKIIKGNLRDIRNKFIKLKISVKRKVSGQQRRQKEREQLKRKHGITM